MSKLLYILATFDDKTSMKFEEIDKIIKKSGIYSKHTPDIPFHITLNRFETNREEEVICLLRDVCSRTRSFDLAFNHIGLFGLKVMFLAPDSNHELLELYEKLDQDSLEDIGGWTPHATILIDEPENIMKALPLVAENFRHLDARVEKISLYEFFPTRFIAEYHLK